jgi:hypothetical protein
MKTNNRIAPLLVAALLGVGGASAHDDAYLDTLPAPNGGQVRMAGAYHYELVLAKDGTDAKERPVVVYVTDHAGQAIPTAGASGTATILSGKAKVAATLTPDGDNRMKGAAEYAATPGMKAVVSIALVGKEPEQARFTPK